MTEEQLFLDSSVQKSALTLVHKMLRSEDKSEVKSAVVIIQTFQLYKNLNITTSLPNISDEASLLNQFESLPDNLKRQVKLYVKEVTNDQLRLSRALKWTSKTQTESLGALIRHLKSNQMLPAILFDLNRERCDQIAMQIVATTEKLVSFEHKAEIERIANRFRNSETGYLIQNALRALEHGIGIHHAGYDAQFRLEVESLFRRKILPVVVATSTLAVGIHMPCKTVVFVGENERYPLSSIEFSQMSGRAGRRGFDTVGNVVLCGNFTLSRIQSLVLAQPEPLRGLPSLTPSFLLQLLKLSKYGLHAPLRALQYPLYANSKDINAKEINRHLFLFCMEFLKSKNYVDDQLWPSKLWTNSVLTLDFLEPTNFLLVELIKNGSLNSVISSYDKWQLLNILCYFNGVQTVKRDKLIEAIAAPESSLHDDEEQELEQIEDEQIRKMKQVVLDPLPLDVIQSLNQFNCEILSLVAKTIYTYQLSNHKDSNSIAKVVEDSIQLYSKYNLSIESTVDIQTELVEGSLQGKLTNVSPFTALSGHLDLVNGSLQFSQWKDQLVRIIKLPLEAFPLLDIIEEGNYNSYIYEFVRLGGNMSVIAEKHGLSFGDLRKNLTEFKQFLNKTRDLVSKLSGIRNEEINTLHDMVIDIQNDFERAMQQAKLPSKSPRKAPQPRFRNTEYSPNREQTRSNNNESPKKPPQQPPKQQQNASPKKLTPNAKEFKPKTTPKKKENNETKASVVPKEEPSTPPPEKSSGRGRGSPNRGGRGRGAKQMYQPKQ